jgi:hypothetical protein
MAGPGGSAGWFETRKAGAVTEVESMGMLLMMSAGWISRYPQDVVGESEGRTL